MDRQVHSIVKDAEHTDLILSDPKDDKVSRFVDAWRQLPNCPQMMKAQIRLKAVISAHSEAMRIIPNVVESRQYQRSVTLCRIVTKPPGAESQNAIKVG